MSRPAASAPARSKADLSSGQRRVLKKAIKRKGKAKLCRRCPARFPSTPKARAKWCSDCPFRALAG